MKHVEIFTDGSSRGNPGPGGYGTILRYKGKTRELSQGFHRTTNNRMELMAALIGLESLKEKCKVSIYSDSKYVVDAINKGWIVGWRQKGWTRGKAGALKNADLWKRIYNAFNRHDTSWHWVKGHAGHAENERCDELATMAADCSDQIPDKEFEKSEEALLAEEKNDLLFGQ